MSTCQSHSRLVTDIQMSAVNGASRDVCRLSAKTSGWAVCPVTSCWNYTNTHANVYVNVVVTKASVSSRSSFDECRLSAGWLPTLRSSRPTMAVSPPVNGCYHPGPPSPFVIITQLKSRYSFYRPREGGRLSRPMHCKDVQPVPKAVLFQCLSW